jgi:L-threonylcarbamoyladenylate synthase
MRTFRVDPSACGPEAVAPAVVWLRGGGIVAFPTDTVYGLAVDPASDGALQALFDLKGRAPQAAVPLIAASTAQLERWCGALGSASARLAARFWPGPLSLVLDAPPGVSAAVHGGRGTVAVRVPAHPVARALADAWGSPVTATSANRSGEPPGRTAGDLRGLAADDRVLVLDAGPAPGGAPSTIVDVRTGTPVLVREGAVAWSRVLESLQG